MRRHEKTMLTATILALALAGSSLGFAGERPSQAHLARRGEAHSTEWLSRQVRHQLLMLPYATVFDNLEYRVNGYRVELLGQVVDPVLKSDAESAVKRIEGVEGVTNHIQVLPLSNFDDQIRFAMYRAIYGNPVLSKYGLGANPSIHIIVDNGHVTLVGVVNSKMDKEIATLRANSVPGVFSVKNDLKVQSS